MVSGPIIKGDTCFAELVKTNGANEIFMITLDYKPIYRTASTFLKGPMDLDSFWSRSCVVIRIHFTLGKTKSQSIPQFQSRRSTKWLETDFRRQRYMLFCHNRLSSGNPPISVFLFCMTTYSISKPCCRYSAHCALCSFTLRQTRPPSSTVLSNLCDTAGGRRSYSWSCGPYH